MPRRDGKRKEAIGRTPKKSGKEYDRFGDAALKHDHIGFKDFTTRPVFGGRGLSRVIPKADDLFSRVLDERHRIVIGAKTRDAPEHSLSYWKLSKEDLKLFLRLCYKYEELEPQYNGLSAIQRSEWDKRLTCCKALFCLNAIHKTQGYLASQADKRTSRGSLDDPLQSTSSPFTPGTREILERIGTQTDMMFRWWYGECPDDDRSDEKKQAVESVKTIITGAYNLLSIANGRKRTTAMEFALESMQNAAVVVVQDFKARWRDEFPISGDVLLDAVIERSKAGYGLTEPQMKGIQKFLSDRQSAREEELAEDEQDEGDETMEGADQSVLGSESEGGGAEQPHGSDHVVDGTVLDFSDSATSPDNSTAARYPVPDNFFHDAVQNALAQAEENVKMWDIFDLIVIAPSRIRGKEDAKASMFKAAMKNSEVLLLLQAYPNMEIELGEVVRIIGDLGYDETSEL